MVSRRERPLVFYPQAHFFTGPDHQMNTLASPMQGRADGRRPYASAIRQMSACRGVLAQEEERESPLPAQRPQCCASALFDIGVLDRFEDGLAPALIGSEPECRGKFLKVEDFQPSQSQLLGDLVVADRFRLHVRMDYTRARPLRR
jgi:hypothetical protein